MLVNIFLYRYRLAGFVNLLMRADWGDTPTAKLLDHSTIMTGVVRIGLFREGGRKGGFRRGAYRLFFFFFFKGPIAFPARQLQLILIIIIIAKMTF